jgi:hypothetical protein
MGAQDGKHVLVPFVELNLIEQDGDDESEHSLISVVLTFENLGYVLESLGEDFLVNCLALSEVASGGLKPPAYRVTFSLEKLRGAQASLAKCVALLEALEPTLKRPVPQPRSRRRRAQF